MLKTKNMASFAKAFVLAILPTILTLFVSIPWLVILYFVTEWIWQVFAYVMIGISGEAYLIFTYERSKEDWLKS